MSPRESVVALITALLSVGGASFIGSLAKGWGTLRSGARAREREAVDDLARARDEADERCRRESADRLYWQRIAGRYAYQLVRAGIEPDPANLVPPSERPGGGGQLPSA